MVLTMWPSILSKKLSMALSRVLTMMRSQQECIVQNQKTGTIQLIQVYITCINTLTRGIKTEEKAKVVAAVWVTDCIQFPTITAKLEATSFCAQGRIEEFDELHQDDLKKRLNSSYSLKLSW